MLQKLVIYGETDGSSTTGDFELGSEWWANKPTELKIEKGLQYAIKRVKITGVATKLLIQASYDDRSTWEVMDAIDLASEGNITEESNVGLQAHENDKVYLKLSWEQPSAGKAYGTCVLELKEID